MASEFLNDFGVAVVFGGITTKGILDAPGEVVAGGMVLSTDYQLTFQTSTMSALDYQSTLTAGGVSFIVREVRALDDGAFSVASMSKV
jgi:hypothetical protein